MMQQRFGVELFMPRFFFDITLGRQRERDDDGIELVSEQIACEQARAVLPEIARDCLCTQPEPIMLRVRNESGATVYVGKRVIQPRGLNAMLRRCMRTFSRFALGM